MGREVFATPGSKVTDGIATCASEGREQTPPAWSHPPGGGRSRKARTALGRLGELRRHELADQDLTASGEKYLFQSVIEAVAPDPLSPGAAHTGVQAGPLADVLEWLHDGGDYPTWRRLAEWPGRDDVKVWDAARAVDGNEFPVVWKSPGVMNELATLAFVMTIWYEGRYAKEPITDPMFCSGAVAFVLQNAGILEGATYPPNAYEPKDFSSLHGGFAEWTSGVVWDDDRWISMPGDPS